ncbi:MAG: DUF58 domain-containing protein [Elusimicrobia bacterium]|nr:DUF58 domain-containing protein [Elusimicrobiota bacterium]
MTLDRLRHVQMMAYSCVRYWLGRRWTPAGRLVIGALAGSAVLGFDTAQSMAFQSFTFLLSLLLLAFLSNLKFRPKLAVARGLPRLATAGEPFPYSASLVNLGSEPLRGLSFIEEVEDPRPSYEQYRALKELPGDNWLERVTGYGRWLALVARKRIVAELEKSLPDLLPGQGCELSIELVPSRRGMLRLRSVSLARPDAMGLFNAISRQEAAQDVVVLPKRYPAPRLELSGNRRYQPGGVSLSSRVGDSQEFMALRDYRPGDPLRRIHWKSWAKTGKPVVKEYEDEYFVRHALVLDTFAAPGAEGVFEEAVSVAASFACSLLTQESLLDLLFVGDKAYCFTAGRGQGGPETLLEVLACAEICSDKPFSELGASVASRRESLSGCLCVLLAFDDQRRELVRRLRSLGVPVVAAVVSDPLLLSDETCAAEGLHRLEPGRIAEGLAGMARAR